MKLNNLHTIFEQTGCLYRPQEYIGGRLFVDERHYFERHILSCPMCRDEYEGLLAMSDLQQLPVIISDLNNKVDFITQAVVKHDFSRKYRFMRIAAILLVLIGSAYFINFYAAQKSNEYAEEESISYLTAPESKLPESIEDSVNKPVTIASSNELGHKKDISDQTIDEKLSKSSLKKKIEEDTDNYLASEYEELEIKEEITVGNDIVSEPALGSESLDVEYSETKIASSSAEGVSRAKFADTNKKRKMVYTTDNYLDKGISAYESGEYQKAIEFLQATKKDDAHKDKTIYYLGLSHAALDNSKKALKNFNSLLKNKKSTYYNDAKWQKASILIKSGKNNQAIDVLHDLIKSDTYKEKARQKLDSLENK